MENKDHNLDLERHERQGFHEVVYAEGKSKEQLMEICEVFISKGVPLLVTRIKEEQFEIFEGLTSTGFYTLNREGRTYTWVAEELHEEKLIGLVNIISAGTSDAAILREVEATLTFFGYRSKSISDCGVAGIHRILKHKDILDDADVNIVVAGMDGALPSVVGGLSGKPIIAVPTSVGYGAAFNGVAALLTMLNSCSSGVSVVNIDNGYGAAMSAIRILKTRY
jgi:pyridinium-3,5-biscarboxylic acid mononucleotide synthase